jgi:CelD/BcsL family acetyltransferase involved in cellulose biosynthesis
MALDRVLPRAPVAAAAATAGLALDLIRTDAALEALVPTWRQLYEESSPRNPFLSPEWSLACRAHLCPDARLLTIAARKGERLVGVAPLRVDHRGGMRILRFMGKGLSPYCGFLAAPDCPEVEGALLEGLARHGSEWDLFLLYQLADAYTAVHRSPLPDGLSGHVGPSPWKGASYLRYDGDWNALCAAGPGWLKSVQKRVRRFERDGGAAERYLGTEAAARMDEVARVEARAWQGQRGWTRCPEDREQVMGLLRAALGPLGERGEMELWIARVQGEPVAYAINFLLPDRLWLYRGAYDLQWARLGAGSVLEFLSIRHAWQAGVREYDYMSGDEPYKGERTNAVRPLSQLVLHPRTLRGCLAYRALAAGQAARQLKPRQRLASLLTQAKSLVAS